MKKIVIIGGGSVKFARAIARDICTFPALSDSHIVLVDIPVGEKYMIATQKIIQKTIDQGGYPAKVSATLNRREALEGADAVVITIRNDTEVSQWEKDLIIPKKYGVDLCIGDTRGPAAIFRVMRAAPALKAIAEDILELCPNAYVFNYTNPMCMITGYLRQLGVEAVGLCHSVQSTAAMLTNWLGADEKDVTYRCAGINHQAFYLEFCVKGENAYPRLMEVAQKPEHQGEAVRIEMMKALGYFVTESSGHNSEYNGWFRKRQDLIDQYNPNSYGASIREIAKRDAERDEETERILSGTIDLNRGQEYAAYILNAVIGDGEMIEFNGNIPNTGLIPNLPEGAIVEVPIIASKAGLRPIYIGNLPRQIAALNYPNAQNETLAVEGILAGDREMIYRAIINDPLTASVCSLAEIRQMTEELFAEYQSKLPMFQ
ncbi:MAG: alpha-glucosidase/alpha-galactosidase [Ruminococcaceae bacterium]|nr:alpha-glucosidase/alpha-galactosidase [Oscillospiraceae bacterium]